MLDCYISERTCEVKLYRSWFVVAVVICRIVKIASVEVAWMAVGDVRVNSSCLARGLLSHLLFAAL